LLSLAFLPIPARELERQKDISGSATSRSSLPDIVFPTYAYNESVILVIANH